MNIKAKILIPAIVLTILVSAAILVSNSLLFSDQVKNSTAEKVDTALKIAIHDLEDMKTKSASVSLSIAENPGIIEAIVSKNHGELLVLAGEMQNRGGAEFCTITDKDGIVLARTHEPEYRGDSVASQRSIRSALAGQSMTAVEEGSAVLLSARSAVPAVDSEGHIVGVVSAGFRLDTENFVDTIKRISGCESTVILEGVRISTTVRDENGERVIGTRTPAQIAEMLQEGQPYSGEADIQGRPSVSSYVPVMGPDGRPIGALYAGQYLDEISKTVWAFVKSGLIITLVILAVFVTVLLFIAGRIVAPILAMTKAAIALASGDTGIDIEVNTRDEMRTLAGAFGIMVENTRRQVDIVEHIAAGDLRAPVEARSEKDVMNHALEKLNATILAQAAAIREEHARIRLMLDATPLSIRLWDRDFKLIECNEGAVNLFGLRNKQEYLEKYFDLFPEYQPDGTPTHEKIREVVGTAFEKGVCIYEGMNRLSDGTPIPTENTLVRVPYGEDYVVAAYSRDLREQKKMIADIEQRDLLLQNVNQAADSLLRCEVEDFADTLHQCMGMLARAINADRMYIHKNHEENGRPGRIKLYEWPENIRYSPDDSMAYYSCGDKPTRIKEALCRGESVLSLVRDMPAICRECLGLENSLSAMIIPVFIRNNFWGFVGFDNSRSETLFTENEESIMRSGSLIIVNALLRNESLFRIRDTSAKLETALADAKEANYAKSSFLAHMSHEIRTPLNAVIGFSELTLDEGNLNDEAKANMEKIYGAGSTILSIVNDILDISKIESGKFELYPIQYDTPSLINDTVTLNIVRIGEKDIAFRLYVDEDLPGVLFGDDLRVKQIFNNLLSNAFKYTYSGTVEWRVSFERAAGNDGDDSIWLVSSVRDTGMGIKPEDLAKLFSDYNQVDKKSNRRVEGTGLGLSLTKRLVEMMDGTIKVESEYGKGSVFHVRLHQKAVSSAPIGSEVADNLISMRYTLSRRAGRTKQGRVNLSYARILVVDDVVMNLDVVKGMMKPYKVNIDCATSGQEAIEMIRSGEPRYNAIFMDHMMPGMDGIEATHIIHEEIGTDYARNIPVIALTANAIVGNNEMFLSHGFQDFVSKPIDIMKLDSVLRTWVRNKEREKELMDSGDTDASLSGEETDNTENDARLPEGLTIAGVDKDKALESFGGDESILVDVMRSYAASTRPLLINLREYLDTEDMKDYAIVVHGIKGASYGISAQETGDAARVLELAAKAGNLGEVKAGHNSFEKMVETLIDNIEKALTEIDAG